MKDGVRDKIDIPLKNTSILQWYPKINLKPRAILIILKS